MTFAVRKLARDAMADAARIHRAALDARLPWLAGRHTPDDDQAHFTGPLFEACAVWGAFCQEELTGFIATRPGWIDQLHVLPQAQGRGIGSALLTLAQREEAALRLWTFQANEPARAFYAHHGFNLVEATDGQTNEEREPDLLLEWRPAPPDRPSNKFLMRPPPTLGDVHPLG
jgi:GNAT superfamily N-acetyltransferase